MEIIIIYCQLRSGGRRRIAVVVKLGTAQQHIDAMMPSNISSVLKSSIISILMLIMSYTIVINRRKMTPIIIDHSDVDSRHTVELLESRRRRQSHRI